MIICLGKSCSFVLLWVPFMGVCRVVCVLLSLLVLRVGYWFLLYKFVILKDVRVAHFLSFLFSLKEMCLFSSPESKAPGLLIV